MYDAVSALNKKEGIAVLMVSHDICTTLGYATHILHLGRDQIFYGDTDSYRRSDVGHEFIFAHGGICDCSEHSHEHNPCSTDKAADGEVGA